MSRQWLQPKEARKQKGLRLVLTVGVPGPWGEGAKGLFIAKGIPFQAVIQQPGQPNEALVEWTGESNAPQMIFENRAPLNRWNDLIVFAETLQETPRLIPENPAERAHMFGLLHELCGEDGFGWNRRHMLFAPMLSLPVDHPARLSISGMAERYGCNDATAARAPQRCAEVLTLLAEQLENQIRLGREYLIGDQLSALDIYWAAFAALVEPLPDAQCAMSAPARAGYSLRHPTLDAAITPELMAHRDRIYRAHLELPIDLGP